MVNYYAKYNHKMHKANHLNFKAKYNHKAKHGQFWCLVQP
jgi:hypothetical protein